MLLTLSKWAKCVKTNILGCLFCLLCCGIHFKMYPPNNVHQVVVEILQRGPKCWTNGHDLVRETQVEHPALPPSDHRVSWQRSKSWSPHWSWCPLWNFKQWGSAVCQFFHLKSIYAPARSLIGMETTAAVATYNLGWASSVTPGINGKCMLITRRKGRKRESRERPRRLRAQWRLSNIFDKIKEMKPQPSMRNKRGTN